MSEIEKAKEIHENLEKKTKELKEATIEANKEKDPVIKEGLLQKIERIADDLDIIKIKWQGFQQEVAKEEEDKIARRKKHDEEVEKARERKITKSFFDDEDE